ncbi:MAG: hypothetical protein ACE145_14500 [Terriglobia bacterium]
MLVIISDLHLTDGTSGETIREGAFRVFRERLRDAAYDASWRRDGTYKPLEQIDVILLGDILDVIRSTRWLAGPVRPWDNPQGGPFVDRIREVNDAILKNNAASLGILKSLDDTQAVTIPPATAAGKPAGVSRDPGATDRVPVKVKLHYMVGNHDWFYHLPGAAYDEIRKSVVAAAGLANDPGAPFPHDPSESPAIQQALVDHRVFARHGDIFDSFNFDHDRNRSSLGDAIVIELLNRFPQEVARQLGGDLSAECQAGLKEIDNVRPLIVVPVWVNGLLQMTCGDPGTIQKVKGIWDKLADDFMGLNFVRTHSSTLDLFDDVDRLEWALKFSRGVSLAHLSHLLTWIKEKFLARDESYFKFALNEQAFKNRSARYIVYGHTHHYEIVPLDAAVMPSGILNQIYINSGTWRAVHELAQAHPEEQEFLGYKVMTYLSFYREDERGGQPFETWTGSLAGQQV